MTVSTGKLFIVLNAEEGIGRTLEFEASHRGGIAAQSLAPATNRSPW